MQETQAVHSAAWPQIKENQKAKGKNLCAGPRAGLGRNLQGLAAIKTIVNDSIVNESILERSLIALKDRRDATIHLKSHDQYPSGGELEETSLFYRFLNDEIREFPRTAVAMVWFFRVAGESVPRWLNHLVKTVQPQRKKKDRNSCA